ncbi:MAG: uracil-DNA glycosylase [Gammaproteobacteria bacterium]|nr:uracil-DNA glycosylase [Gammaproteobacteria bacterium]
MNDSATNDPADRPDASFVPLLDARQRAMLAEMGVRVWAPKPPVAAQITAPVAAEAPSTSVERAPAPAPASAPVAPAARPAPVRPPVKEAVVAVPQPVAATARHRPADVAAMDWPTLEAAVAGCEACGLCRSRQNTVFGVGDRQADWMVIGEAPGENEDLQGEPFVGVAGQLLDNMLRAVGRSRSGSGAQATYIANVLKCRPPANRNPLPEEVAMCEPYLARQVALVQPKIILAMGRFAVQSLLQTSEPIGRLRGQVHRYQGVPVIVTYHPAYLLRTPTDKAKAWADLCLALETAAASEDTPAAV